MEKVATQGLDALHRMMSITLQVLQEMEQLNLKPPVKPSDHLLASTTVPVASPRPESSPLSTSGKKPTNSSNGIINDDEVQDSFSKISMLRNQYIDSSTQLLEVIKKISEMETLTNLEQNSIEKPSNNQVLQRNSLRKDIFLRNLEMKEMIDKIRDLQQSVLMINGEQEVDVTKTMERI